MVLHKGRARIDSMDKRGRTPLSTAKETEKFDILELFQGTLRKRERRDLNFYT
jgi:hypothetical protein